MYTKEDFLEVIRLMEENNAKYVMIEDDGYEGFYWYLMDEREEEIKDITKDF